MKNNLDKQVDGLIEKLAGKLTKISDDPYVKEAVIKLSVRSLVWELHKKFPEEHNILLEQLEVVTDALREDYRRELDTSSD